MLTLKRVELDFLHRGILIQIRNEEGQSLIEFLITFSFGMILLIYILKFGLSATNGYLAHYANFQASRAYLVIDNDQSDAASDGVARAHAQVVFDRFNLENFGIAPVGTVQFNNPGDVKNVFVGSVFRFRQKFSGGGIFGGSQEIELISESFLGREPTRSTCVRRVCDAMLGVGGTCENHTTFFDNGC